MLLTTEDITAGPPGIKRVIMRYYEQVHSSVLNSSYRIETFLKINYKKKKKNNTKSIKAIGFVNKNFPKLKNPGTGAFPSEVYQIFKKNTNLI